MPVMLQSRNPPSKEIREWGIPLTLILSVLVAPLVVYAWRNWDETVKDALNAGIVLVLIGIPYAGALLGTGYFLLAMLNPRVCVTVEQDHVSPGETLDFAWTIPERAHRIQKLRFHLECREEAWVSPSPGGRKSRKITSFATIEIRTLHGHPEIQSGKARVAIPPDARLSFSKPDDQLVWILHAHGEIEWWPDIMDEFEIPVKECRS